MERFDVLVVGAGPAGSTAAYRLAREGASVLLADRAEFPRDKPCGGGLTMRAVRQLPFSVDPVVEDRSTRVEFGLDFRSHFERHTEEPLVLMTQRSRLDAFLAERAAEAGADFRDGARVTDLELTATGVQARVNGAKIAANTALGADGANGVTAKSLGLDGERDYGVALEANVPYGVVSRERYQGRLCLELANVPGGYGWVFPKGDHVNVGVGGWEREGPRMREHLARFCREYGIPGDKLEKTRGYRLPLLRPRARLIKDHVALIGDAAGLVDPLSGDGIYEAFLSAKLVAEAILADELGRYEHDLRRALSSQLAAAWGAKVALDRFPRLTYAAVRSPYLWKAIVALIGGEVPSPSAMRGLRRASMRVVEAIARASGDPGRAYKAAET
ncbi:MAG: geranylgeranyl reductase family protein [Actinobacteria bacterium]|nr:MAG: geranylgeranyl reductase family protein [Actinomycetota bacterium]